MKGIRYTAEFKAEAIKQITEGGHNTANVAERLGISTKSIYKQIKEAELQKAARSKQRCGGFKARSHSVECSLKACHRRT